MVSRRHLAMLGSALFAGVFEAAHTLTYEGRVRAWAIGVTVVAVFLEVEALTAALDHGIRRRMSPARTFVIAFVIAMGVGVAEVFATWGLKVGLGVPLLTNIRAFRPLLLAELGSFQGLLGLGLWGLAIVVPFAVHDANMRAKEAEQLRTAAELARLRAHLQPHFLLNTLNTVAGLVVEDPKEARNLVGALGDLLRDSLEDTDEMQTLDAEVGWLKRYAEILETRHRGSIRFTWDIEEASRGLRVPRLLLQPLLENAVKHGALRRREGGEVAVRTTVDPERLTCVVEDNGPGPGDKRHGALGLELVTKRLALEYAGAAAFRLEAGGGRTRSIVEIPTEALR